MKTLTKKIEDHISIADANVSVILKEVNGPTLVTINPTTIFHAASTIKLPILFTALSLRDKGLLSFDEKITLNKSDIVGGCGALKLISPGNNIPILDLLKLMICMSDNTATNMLIERIGIDVINSEMAKLGLKDTYLARKLMISCQTTFSKTSANDLVILFTNFTNEGPLSQEALKLGCDILINQQLNNLISRDWYLCGYCGTFIGTDNNCKKCGTWTGNISAHPLPFYHKTGSIVGLEHDAGILNLVDKSYILAILSNGHDDNFKGMKILSDIGNMVLQELL